MILANPHQIIDFGQKNGKTYIDHGDKVKRLNYLKRHSVREDWDSLNAGAASARILWGQHTDIRKNLEDFVRNFDLEVPPGAKIIL
jgi:hypothetical protein